MTPNPSSSPGPSAINEAEDPTMRAGTTLDDWAAWLLRAPLTITVAGLCAVLLAGWIPHYLMWPWWVDLEDFAFCAQGWDSGIMPYRDIADRSFPGQVLLFLPLGRAFGWGRTAPIYALDAGLVVLLGAALAAWSRRVFGRFLPGLIGYASFLWYYLGLDYSLTAQRDWQGPFFAVLAILILQASRGRIGRLASALLLAFAFTFRPHIIFFLPGVLLALDESARPAGGPWSQTARAALEWAAAFAIGLVLVFSPLILAGVMDDFVLDFVSNLAQRGLPGRATRSGTLLQRIYAQLQHVQFVMAWLVLILALADRTVESRRRLVWTWAVTFGAILLYSPVHPTVHAYLLHPLALVGAVCVAVLVDLILGAWIISPRGRLAAALVLVGLAVPAKPPFFRPIVSREALQSLARGERMLKEAPPGYHSYYGELYPWKDYAALLDYLRRTTRPETRVATLLLGGVAVHGPIGRLSVFLTEAGIYWAWGDPAGTGAPKWEKTLAEQLEQATDSVLVWDPRSRKDFGAFTAVIRRHYEPEARFGAIEVWRRKLGTATMPFP